MRDGHRSKRVLIAPLDWGLGHATRCVPVIRALQRRNAEVFIASSGNALLLLKEEFPEVTCYEIASYNVKYSRRWPFMLAMMIQLPRFIRTIQQEHHQIRKIVKDNSIDTIISDNRFGCYTEQATSVFITHQVNIIMPLLLKWIEPVVNALNHQRIRKFDHCWVPDVASDRITGKLTKAHSLKVTYIGMLSRLEQTEQTEKKYHLLILLSGPEPQRTVMEQVIVKQLHTLPQKTIALVRGLPASGAPAPDYGVHCTTLNYVNATELSRLMQQAELVICRSGYSTIMDLARLNKKAIVVPTRGQTEQEYLAARLTERRIAYSVSLQNLNIAEAMQRASDFSGFNQPYDQQLLSETVNTLWD